MKNYLKTLGLVGLLALADCGGKKKVITTVQPAPVKRHVRVVTKEALMYDLNLDCYPNGVVINDAGVFYSVLHFYEGSPANPYPVGGGDSFVLTDRVHQFTHIMLYNGFDASNNLLSFDDWGTSGTQFVLYDPAQRRGDMSIGGITYQIRGDLSVPQKIAIDQNNDGVLDGKEAPIIDQNNAVIHEKDLTP